MGSLLWYFSSRTHFRDGHAMIQATKSIQDLFVCRYGNRLIATVSDGQKCGTAWFHEILGGKILFLKNPIAYSRKWVQKDFMSEVVQLQRLHFRSYFWLDYSRNHFGQSRDCSLVTKNDEISLVNFHRPPKIYNCFPTLLQNLISI